MNTVCVTEYTSHTVHLLSMTKHEGALVSNSKATKGWALSSPWRSELAFSYAHGLDEGYTLYYCVNERIGN